MGRVGNGPRGGGSPFYHICQRTRQGEEWAPGVRDSELFPLNSMLCPPLLATILFTLPGCWARQIPCPALLCGLVRVQGQESPAARASLPAAEQAGAGGAGKAASCRRDLGRLARREPFSGAGAEGESMTLNKAETRVVRLKEAKHNALSCSGQNRPQMDASMRVGPRQGSLAGMTLSASVLSTLHVLSDLTL